MSANKSHYIDISYVDVFPHSIDKDFVLNVNHPAIERHHLYTMFILQVNCPKSLNVQKLYIYPGFISKIDHSLKEKLFHIIYFYSHQYNTNITVRFYRESNDCKFIVEYSTMGAEHIHLRMPSDLILVYETKIILFRPTKLELSISSEDGHQGGLTFNKKGIIVCRAKDGFPLSPPFLKIGNMVPSSLESTTMADDGCTVSMSILALLKYHGTLVTCTSGSVAVTKPIYVFHHASSVKITPDKQYTFKQGSSILCKSIDDGYPSPIVRWSVAGLNDSTMHFFSVMSTSQIESSIEINAATPNGTVWTVNCSAINVIPPQDQSGPYSIINITIGETVIESMMISTYMWIITVMLIIIVIVVIGVCLHKSYQCRCERPTNVVVTVKEPTVNAQIYSAIAHNDRGDDHNNTLEKDMDNFV